MNSSLIFHEELATDVINAFQEKLLDALANPSKGLAAFRFYLEEEHLLRSTIHNQLSYQGELGLIWQDGSISLHAITPTLLQQPELPLANWASCRFFHSDHRYLVPRNMSYGSPRIFDRSLADHVSNHSLPELPESFTATISMHKRTYADSRKVQIFEQETRLYLKPLFTSPFSYEFRRLPAKTAWEYMQTEALWFASFNPLQISFFIPTEQTICLLSPHALQDLLLPCFLSQDFQIAYQQKTAPSPTLKAWYDPKRRSGVGSHRFDRRGSPLYSFNLGKHNPYPLPDLPEQEIALGLVAQTNKRVSFRPWLQSQAEVLFIPAIELPDDYQPLQEDQLFCPQATLFCYGKPVLQTALLLPVSCPRLISSKNLTSVYKPLWDVPGLAFPALSLECTS
ncbi:hypothetical protein [Brevibacillus laterosporus]|uniref:hypothetical protein n=1 Tax=Brevibacillus laterosporus TaxID=1465 RepID=UPI002652E227|nr:hypothetical protein [Brevibacillus laterosporus]MDN9012222.1 hypothetical protein [Brevibacillus laterosporus]MDO0943318.1 hypothetical protein [Brevibacillus laterosporus]